MSKPNTFTCANCKGVFEKGWSDEAAAAELTENFGSNVSTADCEVVCDDCYKQIMVWAETDKGAAALADALSRTL